MTKNAACVILASGVLALVVASSVRPAAGQAAASAAATYLTSAELTAALAKATATNPDMSSANVKNSNQYRINIVRRGKGAGALAHKPGTELHYIVDGAGILATGGTIVRPAGGGTASIDSGVVRRVAK